MNICLDAGHGGIDPGAVFKSYREKDIALSIVLQLEKMMKEDVGHFERVTLTRSTDKTVSLGERCRLSNAAESDIFVSIHLNADPDDDSPGSKEATGAEVWVYPQNENAIRLAKGIHQGFAEAFPHYPWRGIRESDKLYVLKHTRAIAVLVEVGFVDSTHDSEFLARPGVQLKIAKLLHAQLAAFAEVLA